MRRLRIVAAMVAILTIGIDWLLSLDSAVSTMVLACVALASFGLAAIVPFDAVNASARYRLIAVCAAFFAAVGFALVSALRASAEPASTGLLAALMSAGAVLTLWAFAIRNRRRRRGGWSNYYDN